MDPRPVEHVTVRDAVMGDLPSILELMALGAAPAVVGADPEPVAPADLAPHQAALAEIDATLRSRVLVAAVDAARAWGCYRVQLTSNEVRTDAHRFYAREGFVASHEGFKLALR